MNYYNIAVKAPLTAPLVYQSKNEIPIGSFVTIPLGSRQTIGLVLSLASAPEFKAKDVLEVDTHLPCLDPQRIKWLQWMAKYYFYPIGLVSILSYIQKKKSYKDLEKKEIDPLPGEGSRSSLNPQQSRCLSQIEKKSSGFQTHLLHGVTGSGKTEIYLELIEKRIKKGQSVLVLVPDISLTPQLFSRFEARFKGQVALLHSNVPPKQRYYNWMQAVTGQKRILIGARSALFCAVSNLSLIIIDEEHETHFKQDDKLKYHCRDAAIKLAQEYNIPILLGSATPSLETWLNAQEKKYEYHILENRFENKSLPNMQIINLKDEEKNKSTPFWMSTILYKSIKQALIDKEQVALFLNRRGQSSVSLCAGCNQHIQCPDCDITLTLHADQFLVCHYCNHSLGVEQFECTSCKDKEVLHLGVGTEKIFDNIKELFPEARVQLADSDHVSTHAEYKKLVKDMEDKKIDILIGTQMIAKGLDFEGLFLVGILFADLALYNQDFRASEKCFQLITQMGGRCGRHGKKQGQVLIQTYNPDHYAIQSAAIGKFQLMSEVELKYRKQLFYPPYSRLLCVRVISKDAGEAKKLALQIKRDLQATIDKYKLKERCECLGPAPLSIFKLRGRYRYQLLIKSKSPRIIQQLGQQVAYLDKQGVGPTIQLDRDPYFL